MRMAPILSQVVALLAVSHALADAQQVRSAHYFAIGGGLAAQPTLLGVRSNFGTSIDLGLGWSVAAHSAFEARMGGQFFPAGDLRINPGSCLADSPCRVPHPSAVRVLTLAGDYVFGGDNNSGPRLIAGLGYRYIDESPETRSELRPFIEVGAGIGHSFGSNAIGLEGRIQFANASTYLPRWTLPFGINVRFF